MRCDANADPLVVLYAKLVSICGRAAGDHLI